MSLLSGSGTALHSFRVDCGPAGIEAVAASLQRLLRIHAFVPIKRETLRAGADWADEVEQIREWVGG